MSQGQLNDLILAWVVFFLKAFVFANGTKPQPCLTILINLGFIFILHHVFGWVHRRLIEKSISNQLSM